MTQRAMYLVDGNNVMGQRVGWHRDKPGARRRLIEELARFRQRTGAAVAVVFDGAPDPDLGTGASDSGVAVYFAHPGGDADVRILELTAASDCRSDLVAVTSDRVLSNRLRELGVQLIRSGEFRRLLEEETEPS